MFCIVSLETLKGTGIHGLYMSGALPGTKDRAGAYDTDPARENPSMSIENSATLETSGTGRRIDSDRIKRALTDDITVREHAPGQYLVARDGDDHDEHDEHLVDVEAGTCDGADAHYRDVVCVHMVRASLHHAYRQTRNTRLVARVLAAVRELGCPYDVAGCGGPTDEGQRGLPCEGCIAATPGHWVVYQRLTNGKVVEPDIDRGEGIATDGGRDQPPTEAECEARGRTELDPAPKDDDRACEQCGETPAAGSKRELHDVSDGSVDADVLCTSCILEDAEGMFADTRERTDGGVPADDPETCAQCGCAGVKGYVCQECADANDDRRDDDIAGSERADFGGGSASGVDEL